MKILEKNVITDLADLSKKELIDKVVDLKTKLNTAEALLEWYKEQFRLSQARKFGPSSEKDGKDGQLTLMEVFGQLFNEAEAFREMLNPEPKPEDFPGEEKKSRPHKRGKGRDLEKIVTKTETFTLPEEDQVCPQCGSRLDEMKKEVRMEIEVIPAETIVKKYETTVYVCRKCEKEGRPVFIKAPGAPEPLYKGSPVTPAYISWLIHEKFVNSVPYYRLEQDNRRNGIPITRNNMCNWVIRATNDWLQLIFDRMQELLLGKDILHCDETKLQVLREPGRTATSQSWVWVVTSAESEETEKTALYFYSETRAASEARKILKGFSGYIMCDGYPGYDALKKPGKNGEAALDITTVACMVHIAREFKDTLKSLKPGDCLNTSAGKAVRMLQAISHADNQFDGLPYDERKEKRLEVIKPMLDEFFTFIDDEKKLVLPKCHYGKAVNYAFNQKEKLYNVLLDGRLEFNNSMAERTVKPFVIGRKNWLFSNTPNGAHCSCVDYSIVETAKMNGLNPYRYIKYLLEEMPKINVCDYEELDRLLPWSKDLPDKCRAIR